MLTKIILSISGSIFRTDFELTIKFPQLFLNYFFFVVNLIERINIIMMLPFFSRRRPAARNWWALPGQRRAPASYTQQSGREREKKEKERDQDREGDEQRRVKRG